MFDGVKQNVMAGMNVRNTILEETLNDRCLLPISKDEEHIVSVTPKEIKLYIHSNKKSTINVVEHPLKSIKYSSACIINNTADVGTAHIIHYT